MDPLYKEATPFYRLETSAQCATIIEENKRAKFKNYSIESLFKNIIKCIKDGKALYRIKDERSFYIQDKSDLIPLVRTIYTHFLQRHPSVNLNKLTSEEKISDEIKKVKRVVISYLKINRIAFPYDKPGKISSLVKHYHIEKDFSSNPKEKKDFPLKLFTQNVLKKCGMKDQFNTEETFEAFVFKQLLFYLNDFKVVDKDNLKQICQNSQVKNSFTYNHKKTLKRLLLELGKLPDVISSKKTPLRQILELTLHPAFVGIPSNDDIAKKQKEGVFKHGDYFIKLSSTFLSHLSINVFVGNGNQQVMKSYTVVRDQEGTYTVRTTQKQYHLDTIGETLTTIETHYDLLMLKPTTAYLTLYKENITACKEHCQRLEEMITIMAPRKVTLQKEYSDRLLQPK